MKKLFFVLLLTTLLIPSLSFSFDTAVKGFIALDALNLQKIQNKNAEAVIGIGVLDLKVFAEQDNVTAAIKLDLDGKLSEDLNIFEEAYASYRGIPNLKFSLGKSVVKFQNLHWGAAMNTYLDGGSILGTENSWRKVSRKNFLSAAYGHHSKGFLDTFTIWGDSSEIDLDEQGKPKTVSRYNLETKQTFYGYSYKNVPAFTTEKQLGFGNKLELYRFNSWTFTLGQIYFKNKVEDKPSWALDFGTNSESAEWETWTDLLVGFTTKAPYEKFTTYRKYEYFLQMGAERILNEKWSIVGNTEYLFVKDQRNKTTDVQYQDGSVILSTSYKVESVMKYKLSKTSFVTMGGMYERKIASINGVKGLTLIPGVFNANLEAFKLATSFSFWF
jgi:hypothetical protein